HGGPQARRVRADAVLQGPHDEGREGRAAGRGGRGVGSGRRRRGRCGRRWRQRARGRRREGRWRMSTSHATSRYIRSSAQKAGLVLDQIRGRDVGTALAALHFSRKLIARDIEKVLRSAIANVQQQDGFGGDVDRLFVSACYANQGPSM